MKKWFLPKFHSFSLLSMPVSNEKRRSYFLYGILIFNFHDLSVCLYIRVLINYLVCAFPILCLVIIYELSCTLFWYFEKSFLVSKWTHKSISINRNWMNILRSFSSKDWCLSSAIPCDILLLFYSREMRGAFESNVQYWRTTCRMICCKQIFHVYSNDLIRVFGNSQYKLLGLVEGAE